MTRYTIDPESSTVTFAASTTLHPVVATAPASGWFEAEISEDRFAADSRVAGALEIAVDTLSSGNPLYDAETRRRIDVRSHPLIAAEITSIRDVEGPGAVVEGTVTFHGETVLLEGELAVLPGLVLSGEGTVDIRWWDLHPPRLLAFRVDPEVVISVKLALRPDETA